ncbi:hypothetical protein V8G54_021458 [Vigna mungo]|uniref:Uncharacterized protein n=1 Tax=Vigna mungo TaxID=3915 RepID=A0AAQ3NEE3_VIGMU
MHGITERYLSGQKADAAGFFVDEACHQIERNEMNVRSTGVLSYIPRFATLATRMEQYIQGQSRDFVDQAYTKFIFVVNCINASTDGCSDFNTLTSDELHDDLMDDSNFTLENSSQFDDSIVHINFDLDDAADKSAKIDDTLIADSDLKEVAYAGTEELWLLQQGVLYAQNPHIPSFDGELLLLQQRAKEEKCNATMEIFSVRFLYQKPTYSHTIRHSRKLETCLKAVNLVGDIISLPGSSIFEALQTTFSEFLKRLTDRDFGLPFLMDCWILMTLPQIDTTSDRHYPI